MPSQEEPDARAAAELVVEIEGGIVPHERPEGADLVAGGALRRERGGAEKHRRGGDDRAANGHGIWRSSTRRFCARPSGVAFVAIGIDSP